MSENSIQGNGNWYYTDGKWVSDEGADLSVADAFASGNPPAGYIPDNAGGSASGGSGGSSGNPFAGGSNPFIGGGGNVSTTSEDGQYTFNYTRTADDRSLVPDDNNPFSQLLGVLGADSDSLASGSNPFAGGSAGGSSPFSGDSTSSRDGNPQLGGNNPFAAGGSGNSASGDSGGNLPANLPIRNAPPSSTGDSVLPEAPGGLAVPYNSDNWISDLKDLESGEPGANTGDNTGSGNGNWFYGSNNTANGNGNWYFSDGNTSDGNGNWFYGSGNTANGNGNWNFGSDNTANGNGNWQIGDSNTINGNGNRPSGSGNNILGNANTSNTSDSSLLGNRIEASDDSKSYIGNEDWSFDILDKLNSVQMGASGVGSDVQNLLNHPDIISTTMSKEGFSNPTYLTNPDYQFNSSGGI